MKIYTMTGDNGTTTLPDGTRVPKNDSRVEMYGAIDELSAYLGLLVSCMDDLRDKQVVEDIQRRLFFLSTSLPGYRKEPDVLDRDGVEILEKEIDTVTELLPPLRSFILSGGTHAASVCHVCRAVCRRVERCLVSLSCEYGVSDVVLQYINRLSDYLFVLARKLNFIARSPEKSLRISCG